jgi:hypothetical protein
LPSTIAGSKEAALDVVQQYHSALAQRLSDEAALIPGERRLWSGFTNANNKGRTMASELHRPPHRHMYAANM